MSGQISMTGNAVLVTKRALAFGCLAFARPPFFTGSSTATWHLAPATARAPNRVGLTLRGGSYPITQGLGTVDIIGVYTFDATDRKYGHCQISAPTGSKEYPAVAPGPFVLAIAQDPDAPSRAIIAMGLGSDVQATLGPPYGSCATSLTGEPDADTTSLKSIPKSSLGRPLLTVKFAGHTNRNGIDYTGSTTINLKLIKRHSWVTAAKPHLKRAWTTPPRGVASLLHEDNTGGVRELRRRPAPLDGGQARRSARRLLDPAEASAGPGR